MTQFEYISAAISIVLALSIARCLDAIPSAFAPGRRYWVHFVWLMVKLANPVVFWWELWEHRQSDQWSFVSFLGMLVIVCVLYLQVIALASSNPDAVSSWREHYYAKRRLFFGTNAVLVLGLLIASQLATDGPVINPLAAIQATMVGLSVAAMISANPKLHGAIATLAGLTMFGANFTVIARGLASG